MNDFYAGHVIAAQLMDVTIRVQAIRPFAVSEMAQLLDVYGSSTQFSIMQDVLYAAAFLCGEFSRLPKLLVRSPHFPDFIRFVAS